MRYGYVTNGFLDHSLEQVLEVLERLGYRGIGITLGPAHLDPFTVDAAHLRRARRQLAAAGLEPVIETGGRYVLDAFRKHRPSLVSREDGARQRRVTFIRRAIEIATELEAKVVSVWSGTPLPGTGAESCWQRLEACLPGVLETAARAGVKLGFEPEPGMFIESLADYAELRRRLPHPALGLTLDLGHLAVTESEPHAPHLRAVASDLVNVHIDDCRGRRHEHLPLGEGEVDFAPLLAELARADYRGLILVELSRHSHEAPLQAQRSILFLRHLETVLARSGSSPAP